MGLLTSEDVVRRAAQSILGRILSSNFGFSSMLSWTNSASLGCRGKEAEEDLHALTAQVKKLSVRIFILTESRFLEVQIV